MLCVSHYTRVLKAFAMTSLVAGFAVAQAFASAATKHPAGVPDNFEVTPFGYYHPSCIHHLAKGDNLREDLGVVQHTNGTSETVQQCAFPHYKADGIKVDGLDKPVKDDPTIGHAWVEYASISTTSAYGQIYSEWDVPPTPSNNDGQTLYFFNGLEDINDVVTIIQPVLGWNSDYASSWGAAAWNCCYSGGVWEATPVPVNPGDHLEGYVFMNCGSGTKTCTSWDIVIWDRQNGQFSELLDTSNYGQTFNWAFGGVLEVYNIVQCGDYPPADYAGGTGFFNQSVLNDKFTQITPAWKVTNLGAGLSPQCNYGGSTPKQIILTF